MKNRGLTACFVAASVVASLGPSTHASGAATRIVPLSQLGKNIVPDRSVGRLKIGATKAQAQKAIRAPHQGAGDSWSWDGPGRGPQAHYVAVTFRSGRIASIETSVVGQGVRGGRVGSRPNAQALRAQGFRYAPSRDASAFIKGKTTILGNPRTPIRNIVVGLTLGDS